MKALALSYLFVMIAASPVYQNATVEQRAPEVLGIDINQASGLIVFGLLDIKFVGVQTTEGVSK
jgi:hypothetical protein